MEKGEKGQEGMTYCIADFLVDITFAPSDCGNGARLLPSFPPFLVPHASDAWGDYEPQTHPQHLFSLLVDDNLRPTKGRQLVYDADTGNGITRVFGTPDGGYEFIIKDISGRSCALLQADGEFRDCRCALNGDYGMRSFGLNDALMLAFAFAGSFHQTALIHASTVMHRGVGYPFVAASGTGKSTHTSLWLKHIEHCQLLNDDNPVVRIVDGQPFVYGSPWSGKTPCYRQMHAPLGAVTRIERAPKNDVERLKPVKAFASLLPACSTMRWDGPIYRNLCDLVTRLVERVPIYTMHCLPDEEAARVCHGAVRNVEKETESSL